MAAELRRCLSPWRRAKRWARRRRRLVACTAGALLLLTLYAGYFVATLPPYGERQLSAALAALQRNELPAAIGHLNEAAAHLPPERKAPLADAYYRVGKAAFDAKDYGLAVEHFTHAIHRGLNSQEVWFYRGASYYLQHQSSFYYRAQEDFHTATTVEQTTWTWAQVLACGADCSLSTGPPSRAESDFHSAMNLGYKSLAVLNEAGLACHLNGSYAKADSYLTEGIETALAGKAEVADSTLLALYYNRAMNEQRWAQNQQRRCNDRSKHDIERAIALAPDDYLPRLLAADLYAIGAAQDEPDWRIAVDHMREGIRLGAPRSLTTLGPYRTALCEAVRAQPGGEELLAAQAAKRSRPAPNRLHVLDELLR
jgi:hypothetical protein